MVSPEVNFLDANGDGIVGRSLDEAIIVEIAEAILTQNIRKMALAKNDNVI